MSCLPDLLESAKIWFEFNWDLEDCDVPETKKLSALLIFKNRSLFSAYGPDDFSEKSDARWSALLKLLYFNWDFYDYPKLEFWLL